MAEILQIQRKTLSNQSIKLMWRCLVSILQTMQPMLLHASSADPEIFQRGQRGLETKGGLRWKPFSFTFINVYKHKIKQICYLFISLCFLFFTSVFALHHYIFPMFWNLKKRGWVKGSVSPLWNFKSLLPLCFPTEYFRNSGVKHYSINQSINQSKTLHGTLMQIEGYPL